MANVIWSGDVQGATVRVVDAGAGAAERLIIEVRGPADAMGGRGWNRQDLITRAQFESLLLGAGIVK
jgi:hypothetical protein